MVIPIAMSIFGRVREEPGSALLHHQISVSFPPRETFTKGN